MINQAARDGTVAAAGLLGMALQAQRAGNILAGTSTFQRADGTSGAVGDVGLAIQPEFVRLTLCANVADLTFVTALNIDGIGNALGEGIRVTGSTFPPSMRMRAWLAIRPSFGLAPLHSARWGRRDAA
jgi:hypothetical protein